MRTNFQMVKEVFTKFTPVQRGVLTGEEVAMIRSELCIHEMDILQLRNLRDFVVLYTTSITNKESVDDSMKLMDMCSGICAVIDEEIFGKGGEI